ncbi:MAG: hypothetical protein WCG10_07420 [Chlamydiota bacterium]
MSAITASLNPTFSITHKNESNFSYIQSINNLIKAIFNTVYATISFPSRYIGSKTWSIPGVILRAPYLVFKKIIAPSSIPSLKNELFGSGYHFFSERQLTAQEAKDVLPTVSMCAFAHRSNLKWVPDKYHPIEVNTLNVHAPDMQLEKHAFFDHRSGLKVLLAENGNEIMISFGAIDAINSHILTPDQQKEKVSNKSLNISCIKNVLGGTPLIFTQADQFFNKLIQSPYFKDKQITLVGQCLGGSLAQFLALKHQLPCYGFNTFPIGPGLQQQIDPKTLKNADKFITHIYSKKDFVMDGKLYNFLNHFFNRIGIKTAGNFGKSYYIPAYFKKSSDIHIGILEALQKHAQKIS